MKIILLSLLTVMAAWHELNAGLIINEAVTASDGDWVELAVTGDEYRSIDISRLYVTMYYGTNEQLAVEPVTIYAYDRAETGYDDRFVVVHLTEPSGIDETDKTGDTNGNGFLDVYCDNYYNSLWNTDGVIAIDTDDDPSNGGIIDFVAYSNMDGTPNSTMEGYMHDAQRNGAWSGSMQNGMRDCAVDIGKKGLEPWMSISRKPGGDTNSAADFAVTRYRTPGKENIFFAGRGGNRLFRAESKKVAFTSGMIRTGKCIVPLFLYCECNIRVRVFALTGQQAYRSPVIKSLEPGHFSLDLNRAFARKHLPQGLYICRIEGSSPSFRASACEVVFIVVAG